MSNSSGEDRAYLQSIYGVHERANTPDCIFQKQYSKVTCIEFFAIPM